MIQLLGRLETAQSIDFRSTSLALTGGVFLMETNMKSVYVMKSGELYKVGIAKDVDKRLKGLQTSNGSKVLIVTHASCGNASQLEKQVHHMLADYRQTGGREWFKLTPEQVIKVCIYIHQQAQFYSSEDEIKSLLEEYSEAHELLVIARKDLEKVSENMGENINKAIGRLQRYRMPTTPMVTKETPKPKPKSNEDDALYAQTTLYVQQIGKASTSLLQREFRIGYGRAARIIEKLERQGIISAADGSRPRTVLV